MNIYVASSFRSDLHPIVIHRLLAEGHEIFDYRDQPLTREIRETGVDIATRPDLSLAICKTDFLAICDADVLIAIAPLGASVLVEIGFAFALLKAVYILGDAPKRFDTFHTLCVHCASIDELVIDLNLRGIVFGV